MEFVAAQRRKKRVHTEAFRQAVIQACCEPGASVAGVALANGVNANLVRKWMTQRGVKPAGRQTPAVRAVANPSATAGEFVPVAITLPTAAHSLGIRIEVRRASSVVQIDWPLAAAGACGHWLREWLK